MSGCNTPCRFCGKWSDDYPYQNDPELDCCMEYHLHMKEVGKQNSARHEIESNIYSAVDDILWKADTVSQIKELGYKIINAIKNIKG